MGQQQLLLVILVTIIVGIATVVAINTFGSAADSANVDAVRQDVAQIAASAQGFYMKPEMLGGGGKDFSNITFNDISFAASGINTDGDQAWNENGVYVISGATTGEFTLTAHPASAMTAAPAENGTADADAQLVATVVPDGLTYTN
jgi:Tfp pilus assembly protein PilE